MLLKTYSRGLPPEAAAGCRSSSPRPRRSSQSRGGCPTRRSPDRQSGARCFHLEKNKKWSQDKKMNSSLNILYVRTGRWGVLTISVVVGKICFWRKLCYLSELLHKIITSICWQKDWNKVLVQCCHYCNEIMMFVILCEWAKMHMCCTL